MPISGRRTKGKVTSREFMQHFGTNICRKIKSDVWSSSCIESINKTETEIAVISDCRFPDEIDAIKKAGGLLSNANTDRVNLAKFIYDGQHIHVPFKKDRKTSKKSKRNRKNKYK